MSAASSALSSPAGPATHTAASQWQGITRLSDWGVIRASGADAASFLQGQLTNDVARLGPTESRLAGYCSAKGRLLATFVVWRDAAGDLLLACSADLLAPTLKRLSMFVLRAKCKLSDASAELPLWGLAGEAASATVAAGDAGRAIGLPLASVDGKAVPRALFVGAAPPTGLPTIDAETWRWLEVMSGTPRIVAATIEQFVPQMVNLELVGGVDFQKGCYPGQEVVARSQYRGTLKRRAYVVNGVEPMRPGQEVFDAADAAQPAGMVVLSGSCAGVHAGLVELKIAAAEGGELHLGAADGPLLRLDRLPYALPSVAG